MIRLEAYQGIVFDLDGTLVDTMPKHLNAWEKTAVEFGFEYDAQWLNDLGGVPSRKIVDRINDIQSRNLDRDAVVAFKTRHYISQIPQVKAFDSMLELVRHYHGKIPMAIGTGSPRINVNKVLAVTGLERYFDVVITSNDVTNHKPDPDTFLLAAERLGVEPKQCVVFEDTPIGKQAAMAAKMDCLIVNRGQIQD